MFCFAILLLIVKNLYYIVESKKKTRSFTNLYADFSPFL